MPLACSLPVVASPEDRSQERDFQLCGDVLVGVQEHLMEISLEHPRQRDHF